jgi:hypothetical protein
MSRSHSVESEPGTGAGVSLPRWIVPSTLLASLAGLGVSIYLTIAHYTTSPESVVLGIPVALLGLVFFVAMLGLNSPWAWRSAAPLIRRTRLASAIVGVGFVCWLVYAELFKVDAICLWCTSVHFIDLVLFSLVVIGTAETSGRKYPSGYADAAAAS